MYEFTEGFRHDKITAKERARINRALRKNNLTEVSFVDPKMPEGYRWWFEGPNLGDPFDTQMGNAVAQAVEYVKTSDGTITEL